jgi:hypothetical protein
MTVWSKKTLYDRIVDRWSEKATDYSKVNRNRDLMATYFRSDELIETNDKGDLLGQAIYNGSGSWFSRMMATGFQGALVSKNIPWIRYQMEQYKLKGIDELDIWTQNIKEHMQDVYQRSNFYDIQPNFTHNGLTTGSPVIFGEEKVLDQKIMWMPQHYKTVRVYYDKFNQPEGVIVKDKTWTAKEIMDKFIKNDDEQGTKRKEKLSISVNQAIDSGQMNDTFVVFKAVFKINDPIWEGGFKKPKGNWRWLSVYFLELTEVEKNKQNTPLNENMGDFSQPFAIWDFDKKPWEVASRTPAYYALWDNLSLQQVDKNYGEDLQTQNRPPFIALATMRGKLDLNPEGEMFGSKEEYDNPPKFIDRVGNIQFSIEFMDIKIEALKRWFYIDKFQMFSDLAMAKNQPVSASQIWQMAGEKATLLSPAIETHSRYLETTDARMIDIEARAGRGPFNPDTMGNITDIVVGVLGDLATSVGVRPVFIGQLAQAQKKTQAMEPIMSGIGAVRESGLYEIDQDLVHAIRAKETHDELLEATDFPAKLIVPKEEYAEIKAGLNQQRAADKQAEMALEAAKASKNLQGPVDETSILANAVEAVG